MPLPGDFPSLAATAQLPGKHSTTSGRWFDARFYPYARPGQDPVFAVTGGRKTTVVRPRLASKPGEDAFEILQEFYDEDELSDDRPVDTDETLNSVCWSQDVLTRDPLLCVAGDSMPNVKVLDVKTGTLVRVLAGHGALIEDLATSPRDPAILATASRDRSARIWHLDPAFRRQPCAAILSGRGGHQDALLTLAFHASGRYLLTGGMDTAVKLWRVPELPDATTGTDAVATIHDPHFSTTELHADLVDCVGFFGDLVLSKCAQEHKIVLWKIDGFDALADAPTPPLTAATAPTSDPGRHGATTSAWGGRFQRLKQFDCPNTAFFCMRFSLFHMPSKRPMLAVGTSKGKLLWWDLHRVAERGSEARTSGAGTGTGTAAPRGGATGSKKGGSALGGPFALLPAHASAQVFSLGTGSRLDSYRMEFIVRGVSWSPGGEWMVAVGDQGMICLFRRWH